MDSFTNKIEKFILNKCLQNFEGQSAKLDFDFIFINKFNY